VRVVTLGRRFIVWSLSALAGGLLSFGPLAAQTSELRGLVLDPDGVGVPGLGVAVHRGGEEGGAQVSLGETDAEGRFLIPIELPPDSAIYFVTTRYEGALHVGTPFRGPIADAAEQVVELSAGVPASALGGSGSMPPPPPPQSGA
jgi:hypothetical protein